MFVCLKCVFCINQFLLVADIYPLLLIKQIDEQRHYIERVCRGDEHMFGLPHSIISKQLVSVLSDR